MACIGTPFLQAFWVLLFLCARCTTFASAGFMLQFGASYGIQTWVFCSISWRGQQVDVQNARVHGARVQQSTTDMMTASTLAMIIQLVL